MTDRMGPSRTLRFSTALLPVPDAVAVDRGGRRFPLPVCRRGLAAFGFAAIPKSPYLLK